MEKYNKISILSLLLIFSLIPINVLAESKVFESSTAPYSWFFYPNDPDFNNPNSWNLVTGDYGSGNIAEWIDGGGEKYIHLRANEVTGNEWTYSQAEQGTRPHSWGYTGKPFQARKLDYQQGGDYVYVGQDEYVEIPIDPVYQIWIPENEWFLMIKVRINDIWANVGSVNPIIDPSTNPWVGVGIGINCQYFRQMEGTDYTFWSDYNNPDPFNSPSSVLYIDVHMNFKSWSASLQKWNHPTWCYSDCIVHVGTKYDYDYHVGVVMYSDLPSNPADGNWHYYFYDLGRILNVVVKEMYNQGVAWIRKIRVKHLTCFVESAGAGIDADFSYVGVVHKSDLDFGWTRVSNSDLSKFHSRHIYDHRIATLSGDYGTQYLEWNDNKALTNTFSYLATLVDHGDTFYLQNVYYNYYFKVRDVNGYYWGWKITTTFHRDGIGNWVTYYDIYKIEANQETLVAQFTEIYDDHIAITLATYVEGTYRKFVLRMTGFDGTYTYSFSTSKTNFNSDPLVKQRFEKWGNGWVQLAKYELWDADGFSSDFINDLWD